MSALGGLACAGLVLAALSWSRVSGDSAPAADVYVVRQVVLPFDAPPPPQVSEPLSVVPFASPIQLEIAAAASPVHIQVAEIPLLAADLPPPVARPTVAARFDLANAAVRPMQDDSVMESRRVFDRRDVDQRPMVVHRVQPAISYVKVRNMGSPSTTMLLLVDTDGRVEEVRLLASSRDADFDQVMLATVREWRFSPAIRKGRKVRCWVQQAITVRVEQGSRFEAF